MNQHEIADEIAALRAEVDRLREERIPQVDRSSRRRDRRLTLAYVMVTAVVVGSASLGSASALDGSNTVFSDDIVDGTVTTLDVARNSLITSDIRDNSLASRDVEDGTLAGADVADGSITGKDINLFDDSLCTGETILGTAVINADPLVPDFFTPNWVGYQHSCSGQTVLVNRAAQGVYYVDFGSQNPAKLAVVSPTALPGVFTERAFASVGSYEAEPGEFIVELFDVNGNRVDRDFQILAY